MEVRRLNWGCGRDPQAGWINSDRVEREGVELVCDIRDGLPLDTDSIDYIASMHALPEVEYAALVPVLGELRRVLKPGGVLRLGLPDVERSLAAYYRNDRDYFLVPDEHMRTIGGKLVTQLVWYGYSRTLFVRDFVEELLLGAGFARVEHVAFGETASLYREIVELDNREPESLFVEGTK